MEAYVCIKQKGTVEGIINHRIRVRVRRDSACGQCNVTGICNMSDVSERIIETYDYPQNLKIGDPVDVTISRNMGSKAVILGYLLPFLLLITILVVFNALAFEEWLSGLISLAALIPYYILLYLFRNRLRKFFAFTVRKEN